MTAMRGNRRAASPTATATGHKRRASAANGLIANPDLTETNLATQRGSNAHPSQISSSAARLCRAQHLVI
jgi:hypothetical protein